MARVSEQAIRRRSKQMLGENNPMWKGNNVGYNALHGWVRRHLFKPDKCQKCFEGPPVYLDLANITGRYTRDLSNWRYLCRKCHMWFDGRLLARDKNGKFVSHKRIKVYRVLPLSPTIGELK